MWNLKIMLSALVVLVLAVSASSDLRPDPEDRVASRRVTRLRRQITSSLTAQELEQLQRRDDQDLSEMPSQQLRRIIIQFTEKYRNHIISGLGGVYPPLDPLYFERLPLLNIDGNFGTYVLSLWNSRISGIGSFQLNDVQVRLFARRVDFDVTVPVLEADSNYHLNVDAVKILKLNPNGKAHVVCKNVRIKGYVKWNLMAPHNIQINTLHLSVDVGSVEKFTATGITGTELGDKAMNVLAKVFSTLAVKIMSNQIAQYAATVSAAMINGVLNKMGGSLVVDMVARHLFVS